MPLMTDISSKSEPAEPTDVELLALHESGAPHAFGELVGRYVDLVYSVAKRRVTDRHLAEDISQNVFLTLLRKADSLKDRRTLGGWLSANHVV